MSIVNNLERRLDNWVGFTDSHLQTTLAVILSGLLLAECFLFLRIQLATGYETSIVESLPSTYWLLFYTILAGSIVLLFFAGATGTTFWRHGLALLLANYLIYMFLPVARGYKLYGRGEADKLRHLGDVQAIVETGGLPGIWYPGEHVLMAELHMLGLPLTSTQYGINFAFTLLHIVAIGAVVRLFSQRRESIAAGLAVGAPLLYTTFHLSAHPAILSFMLLPVVLLVLERYRQTNEKTYLLLLVTLGLAVIYMHPMTTLFMIGMITVTAAYSILYRGIFDSSIKTLSLRLGALFLPLQFIWLQGFRQTEVSMYNMFGPDKGSSPAAQELAKATSVSFTPVQLAWKFVDLYGSVFLYFLTAGLFLVIILVAFLRRNNRYDWGLSATHFMAGVTLAVLFLLRDLVVKGHIRLSRYAILFAAVAIGMLILHIFERQRSYLIVLSALVVLLAAGLGAQAAYEPNRHLTHAEYDGTQYVSTKYNIEEPVYSMDTSHKMKEFVLSSNHDRLWPRGITTENNVPDGLGYTGPDVRAADTYGSAYLVTKTYDRKRHTASHYTPEQQEFLFRYGESHLNQLERDSTANKVYVNGGYTAWRVSPQVDEDIAE